MSKKQADQEMGLKRVLNQEPIKVISIISGKGGVGKTNLSTNLAISLSISGGDVMLMDADLGLANIDVLLGLYPKYNLSHLISGERTINEIIIDGPSGIKIVPGSSGIEKMAGLSSVQTAGIIRDFSNICSPVNTLIVDTSAGMSESVLAFSRASKEVIVVVCDEPASITDAYAMIKVLSKDHGVNKFYVVSNMTLSAQNGLDLYRKMMKVTDHFLDVNLIYLGSVPYDACLQKAIQKQRSVVEVFPRSKASMALKTIAKKISQWPFPKKSEGNLEFFAERLINCHDRKSEVSV